MKYRFYFWFTFFTVMFLFYPGDSYYFHIFAYNRELFVQKANKKDPKITSIPVVVNSTFPEVSALGLYVVDLESFTPILEKNPHEHFYPASTTKIITALVANDLYKPEQVLTVKNVSAEGQIMNLESGEKLTVENLYYGILVHSANDAAQVLAHSVGYDFFVKRMNEKAKELHMRDSKFKNPDGLDDQGQYTTPFDLALAARAFLTSPYLSKFVSTKEIIISDVTYSIFHKLTNVNKLLGEIQGIGGLKTGYTENAGENLVSFYKKNGHSFIIVVLKSEDRFEDSKQIVNWIDEFVSFINPSRP